MTSIRKVLLRWQIGTLLITGLLASFITYLVAWHAFNHLRNDGLAQIAYSIVRHGVIANDGSEDDDEADEGEFVSQIWDSKNELQYSSLENGGPPAQKPGHNTITWNGEAWRTFTLQDGDLTIQVSNPVAHRLRLFREIASWLLLPLSLMVVVLGGMIWLAVGRALRPLTRVRAGILEQNVHSLRALDTHDLPEEVMPLGAALNDLLRKLDHALAMERTFIADAAHELRSPLTAVRLQAQLACSAHSAQDAASRAEALAQLMSGVDRAGHLVEQLLLMARYEPDAQRFAFAEVRLDFLAKQIVGEFSAQADQKRIDLGIGSCQPVHVSGHQESLRALVSNLVDNALRYTPDGGKIDVNVNHLGGQAVLSVTDNGPGIPEAMRRRVFDRFFRLSDAEIPGSGLGLSIVKQVAQLHGGEVVAEDGASAAGLRVRFTMPALPSPER
ncbi:MAG: ATP-binding protein [Propionivibrio sp.]